MNPFTRAWFSPSDMLNDWNDMLSWREHQLEQQRLYQRSQELQHKSTNNCNAACLSNCMKQPVIQQKQHHFAKPHNDCVSSCGARCMGRPRGIKLGHDSQFRLPGHGTNIIPLDWSGMDSEDKEYVVVAYLPHGVSPDDASISVDELNRVLIVKYDTKSSQQEKDQDNNIISCSGTSSYAQRSFKIPDDVDLRAISASKNPGGALDPVIGETLQLLIHLPKLTQMPQPTTVKQIPIQ